MHRLPGRPTPIEPAARPRGYRATSKRRVVSAGKLYRLEYRDEHFHDHPGALEPEEHGRLYDWFARALNSRAFAGLAGRFNFIIVRGGAAEPAVIMNVDEFSPASVRGLKRLAERLKADFPGLNSCFAFLDPSRSDYYLEARRPARIASFKHFFGPRFLALKLPGLKLLYGPLCFSQVNEAGLPGLLAAVGRAAGAGAGAGGATRRLVDLYCGYGLFSFALAGRFDESFGLELSRESVEAAEMNRAHLFPRRAMRFVASAVDRRSLEARLPRPSGAVEETVLLDPPRGGLDGGVVEALAARRPARLVHVFCGIERLPIELGWWKNAGYRVSSVEPLDLFPGTANLEIVVGLSG